MSELNEDILNYEIGDVDVDDTDLTGADEDELLLSDDESFSERLVPNQGDDDLLSTEPSESEKCVDPLPDHNLEHVNRNEIATQSTHDNRKSSGSIETRAAAEPLQHVTQPSNFEKSGVCVSPERDLVSSTNKEDDDDGSASQPTQSQSEQKDSDPSYASTDEQSENTVYEDSEEVSYSQSEEQTDDKSETGVVSQDVISEENNDSSEQTVEDFDAEDSEDVRERRNPKTCVERELPPQQFEENNRPKQFPHNYQRNRHMRPQMPRPNHPYGGPDFNPSFMQQYRGIRRPMPPVSQADFIRGHAMNMMRAGPPNHMQRMPPGMLPPRPLLGPPHQRLPRPPFQTPPTMFGNNPGMPPQGMIRPRGPPNAHQMMPPQRPPFVPYAQPNHPANMRLPMNPSMPPLAPPMNAVIPSPALPLPIIGAPRKVLINPNFKGGVQAATNQLMLDTMKNSQILESKREEELLRQQEAFINQNRLHIEKRRRSREHSPERDRGDREYRDRDRSRSFSPPRRRDRKPYPTFRDNRAGRRANSRDRDNPMKRNRGGDGDSNPEKNDPKTDEDEETRAYRLEIEKQKAQREKILRDKEMRRRKAAEELKKEEVGKQSEEKKVVSDESLPQKFTPLIVTEKKIISLKKKPAESTSEQSQKPKTLALTRKIAASVEQVAVQSGSQIKATLRSSSIIGVGGSGAKKLRIDNVDDDDYDEIDEDELLADSPPTTPAVSDASPLKMGRMNAATKVGDIPTTMFSNRRVVVRNAENVTNNDNNLTGIKSTTAGAAAAVATATVGKGIFDRLDKKVISVNEAAKRKIQRIVINNSSD